MVNKSIHHGTDGLPQNAACLVVTYRAEKTRRTIPLLIFKPVSASLYKTEETHDNNRCARGKSRFKIVA
jgi:hypothetical protein